jgi:DNA-binding beta-propeller fold protein YncE
VQRTLTLTYNLAATTTIGVTQVVTEGITGLDFSLGTGGTCTGMIAEGASCTVNVNFAPLAPGLRMGAVSLFDSGGNPVATAPIYGIGLAPAIAFGPGVQTTEPASGLNHPVGVALDGAGDLFIASYGNGTPGAGSLVKVTPGGVQTTVPTSGLIGPINVAVDGAGDLFIVDYYGGQAVKVTPAGVQTTVASGLSNPVGIALDGAGDVFIGDGGHNRVVKVTPGGVQTTVPVSGLNQPWGVAADAAGDVFIADGGSNNRVVEVTPGGVQTVVPAMGLVNRTMSRWMQQAMSSSPIPKTPGWCRFRPPASKPRCLPRD